MARKRAKKSRGKYYESYRRNRQRIQRLIRNYEKQGFIVDVELPKIPKRITAASVRRLERITVQSIREKTTYLTPEGERLSYTKGKQYQREVAAYQDAIIENFVHQMESYVMMATTVWGKKSIEEITLPYIYQWLKSMLSNNTRQEVADALQKGQQAGDWPALMECYKVELVADKLMRIAEKLEVPPLTRSILEDYVDTYGYE